MRKVIAVSDDDYKLEIVPPENKPSFIEYVTDLFALWDETTVSLVRSPYEDKYNAWRCALSERWGFPVSKSTAFSVLEAVVAQVRALKKTISDEPNSKLSALIQQEKRTPS